VIREALIELRVARKQIDVFSAICKAERAVEIERRSAK
jgi:hypothetical protein